MIETEHTAGALARRCRPPGPQPSDLPEDVLAEIAEADGWTASWWTTAVALAGAAAAGAVAHRRRSRRAAVVAGAGGLLAGLTALNAHVGYVPNAGAVRIGLSGHRVGRPPVGDRGPGTGTTHVVQVPAPARLRMPPTVTWVYTPHGYGSGRRCPVVYLYHGTPGTSADWFGAGQVAHVMDVLVRRGLVEPMIVVAPETNGVGRGGWDTEGLDSTRGGSQVATYLTDVVVPWVDEHYDTVPDYAHRVAGGMSAGAFVALHLGLTRQDVFGQVISLEGFTDPGRGGRRMLATAAEREAASPSTYVHDVALEHPVPVLVSVGARSTISDRAGLERVAGVLRRRGQDVVVRVERGHGHTWSMARVGVAHGLVFASRHLPGAGASEPVAGP